MAGHRSVQDSLYDAICNGDLESVKFCIQNGAKIPGCLTKWKHFLYNCQIKAAYF